MLISKETPWTATFFLLTDASSRYRWCPLKGKATCPGELDIQSMCHVTGCSPGQGIGTPGKHCCIVQRGMSTRTFKEALETMLWKILTDFHVPQKRPHRSGRETRTTTTAPTVIVAKSKPPGFERSLFLLPAEPMLMLVPLAGWLGG